MGALRQWPRSTEENRVMIDLSVMGQSTESRRPWTADMSIDNTLIATVITSIRPQICNQII